MKKILAITNSFLPTPNAIGVCLEKLLYEFKLEGDEIHVLTMTRNEKEYEINGYKVFVVPIPSIVSKSLFFIRKVKTFLRLIKSYPFISKEYINTLFMYLDGLMCKNYYDLVIGVMKPYESAELLCRLKESYPDSKCILYELDSLTDNLSNYNGYTRLFHRRMKKIEMRTFEKIDGIFHMTVRRNYFSQEKYSLFHEKTKYIGIPLLDKTLHSIKNNVKENIRIIYSGMLYKSERKPHYWIKLIENYNGNRKITCDFFSRGDWEDFLKNCEKRMPDIIHVNGYVDKEKLDKELELCNVFLNIGNFYKKPICSIPSKLFLYISTGKPIIHISPNENDVCLPYLQKYPKALIIHQQDTMEKNIEKFNKFLSTIDETVVPWDLISENFKEEMPEYSKKLINSFITK